MVSIAERIWRTATQSYLRPFTAFAGISHRGKSRRLQRVLADFGAEHSFARAGTHLQEHYGFRLGASAAREATLLHAKRARALEQGRSEQSFRILPKEGARQLIAQADGSMICTVQAGKGRAEKRPREWKEMRLVAAQVHGSASALYGAGFSTVEDTGRRWGHCAREAGWGLDSKIHVLGDGADWVRLQSQEVFGKQGRFLVDFYHVSEYLAAAAAAIVPAGRVAGWRAGCVCSKNGSSAAPRKRCWRRWSPLRSRSKSARSRRRCARRCATYARGWSGSIIRRR